MLKRKYRLSLRTQLAHPITFSSPYFTMLAQNNNLQYSRFGCIVSKRVDKRAVVRNKIKRMISSCIQELQEDIKPGYNILFIAKKGILEKPRETVCKAIKDILVQKGFLQ